MSEISMIERARAAFTASLRADGLYDTPVGKCEVAAFRKAMRAAIAEMREPTDAMLDAAQIAITPDDADTPRAIPAALEGVWRSVMAASWHAMIDAAIGPEEYG